MKVSELRRGYAIEYEGDLNVVTELLHLTPGNWRAYFQIKLKNMRTGRVVQRRFSPSDDVEVVTLEPRDMEYLYIQGQQHVFMDLESYEQVLIDTDQIADALPYIKLNSTVAVTFANGKPVSVDLPTSVVLEVTETEPGARGDTVSNVRKPAKLETGLEVKVPFHISKGDKIKVDTRTGEFIERAN
jgi:elongation factor P